MTEDIRRGGTREGLAAAGVSSRAGGRFWELDILGRIWRFFTSVRLALILILLITAAMLAGTLLMQTPPSVLADPEAYDQWLERARAKYGIWTEPLSTLQLLNVFHSFWFRLLIALLTANITVCTVNRWKGIWATAFRTRVRMREAFFDHARFNDRVHVAMPVTTAAERVRRALSRSRFRVQAEADENSVAIYADKNRFSKFGTFMGHLSIVLILAGVIIGGIWGFTDPEFIVAEGTTRDVGMGTGLSVELVHFVDEYYPDGPPKDFRSELIIYRDGVEVKRGTARVNSPLGYGGVRFHQAFYGQAAVMEVRDEDGSVIYSEGVPLAYQTRDAGRPFGSFTLPDRNLGVYVIGPVSGWDDPLIPAGETRVELYRRDSGTPVTAENLTQGTPMDLEGLSFTFARERRFTGLKVVKDPGVNIIWAAATLMIVGLAMLFYFPHRRMWALCTSRPDGTADVRLGMTAQRDLALSQEFDGVKERVRLALGNPQEDEDSAQGDEVV